MAYEKLEMMKILVEENQPDTFTARISFSSNGIYMVTTETGELQAETSGKFQYLANGSEDYPVIGDRVLVKTVGSSNIIHKVLNRRNTITRKKVGTDGKKQLIAANIDYIFICMSLNKDFNIRRLERYLSVASDSGVEPIIVLTKADLNQSNKEMILKVEEIVSETKIIVTSIYDSVGYNNIRETIQKNQTAIFMGSSGVGKSTVINKLIGNKKIKTNYIGKNDKGKHTTTSKELFILSNGGSVIDTPGIRELGIQDTDLSSVFMEITKLSELCKFNDCHHEKEPNCAVKNAIYEGKLSEERLMSYRKLLREIRHEQLKDYSQLKENRSYKREKLKKTKRIRKANKLKYKEIY